MVIEITQIVHEQLGELVGVDGSDGHWRLLSGFGALSRRDHNRLDHLRLRRRSGLRGGRSLRLSAGANRNRQTECRSAQELVAQTHALPLPLSRRCGLICCFVSRAQLILRNLIDFRGGSS